MSFPGFRVRKLVSDPWKCMFMAKLESLGVYRSVSVFVSSTLY